MRLIESIKYRISKFIFPLVRPRMMGIKRNFQGFKVSNTSIGNTTFIDFPERLTISNNTYIGHHNFIEASQGIEIQEGCQITDFVSITTHSSHVSIRLYGRHFNNYKDHIGYVKGPISIGKFSFIGPHSVIMPNTNIGKGSIVSAYSYVKGDFPDFSIIAGNPAVVIGDTRELDEKYLSNHPELLTYYQEWAKVKQ